MKLSLNLLNDFVILSNIETEKIANAMTMSTCEVEEVYETFSHLKNIYLAKITHIEKHPSADKLSICKVVCASKKFTVLCGATNIYVGMIVAFAKVGAQTFLNPAGKDQKQPEMLTIEERTIRGVLSQGMLCSSAELGLDWIVGLDTAKSKDGILDFKKNNPLFSKKKFIHIETKSIINLNSVSEYEEIKGLKLLQNTKHIHKEKIPLSSIFPILLDTIFVIDNKSITHRPDLWGHFGFARELAAIFKRNMRYNDADLDCSNFPIAKKKMMQKKIHIMNHAAIGYYGIQVEKLEENNLSPLYIQFYLYALGMRPIHSVIDISNFVMLSAGHPCHIYDAKKVKERHLSIAYNDKENEVFVGLDQKQRTLQKKNIVIVDGKPSKKSSVIALGGIIGGLETAVTEETRNVFIESALFEASIIRKTSRALDLRTEASQRFEKSLSLHQAKVTLQLIVYYLFKQNPKMKIGTMLENISQTKLHKKNKTIAIHYEYIQKRLGFPLPLEEIIQFLTRLSFKVRVESEKVLHIDIPSFRSNLDISIPEDIIEEIGRLYGYNNIAPKPLQIPLQKIKQNTEKKFIHKIKEYWATNGNFTETLNYSYANALENTFFSDARGLTLENPIIQDKTELRTHLLANMLHQAKSNQDRNLAIKIFELGKTYHKCNEGKKAVVLPIEEYYLATLEVISSDHFHTPSIKKLGQDLKELPYLLELRQQWENLLHMLFFDSYTMEDASSDAEKYKYLHPKSIIRFKDLDSQTIGVIGILHNQIKEKFKIKEQAIVSYFHFPTILKNYNKYKNVKRFFVSANHPESFFEVSVLSPNKAGTHRPIDCIRKLNIAEIQDVQFLSSYEGLPLKKGEISLSYKVSCQKQDGTLTGDELQDILVQVIAGLKNENYPLRI